MSLEFVWIQAEWTSEQTVFLEKLRSVILRDLSIGWSVSWISLWDKMIFTPFLSELSSLELQGYSFFENGLFLETCLYGFVELYFSLELLVFINFICLVYFFFFDRLTRLSQVQNPLILRKLIHHVLIFLR